MFKEGTVVALGANDMVVTKLDSMLVRCIWYSAEDQTFATDHGIQRHSADRSGI